MAAVIGIFNLFTAIRIETESPFIVTGLGAKTGTASFNELFAAIFADHKVTSERFKINR